MAPLRSVPSRSAQPRKSILKSSTEPRKVTSESLFPANKKDRRQIRRAQLVHKIEKSAKTGSKAKRRRPNKKLATTLDALADALPEYDEFDDLDGAATNAGTRAGAGVHAEQQVNIIKRKSMKSRPGAMKRREKIDKLERDRFAKNMAQLGGPGAADGLGAAAVTPEDKWKALRGFISQTMERKPGIGTNG